MSSRGEDRLTRRAVIKNIVSSAISKVVAEESSSSRELPPQSGGTFALFVDPLPSSGPPSPQSFPPLLLRRGALCPCSAVAGALITLRGNIASDTVATLSAKISAKTCIPQHAVRLFSGGKELDAGRTLAECGIVRDSTVRVTARLHGGGRGEAQTVYVQSEAPTLIVKARAGRHCRCACLQRLQRRLSQAQAVVHGPA